MPANRLVVLLTPIVAPIAGWLATQIAKYAPGLEIDEAHLNEIFLAGLGIAFAGSSHWLHGHQKYEAREAEAARAADVANDAELEVAVDERSVIAPELADPEDDAVLDEAGDPLLDDVDEIADDELAFESVGAADENGQ